MAHLPPVAWADLATKDDLGIVRERLEVRIDGVRAEVASVRTEINSVRAELGSEINSVRAELGSEINNVRAELGSEVNSVRAEVANVRTEIESTKNQVLGTLHRELNIQMRIMVAALAATASVIIAAVRV